MYLNEFTHVSVNGFSQLVNMAGGCNPAPLVDKLVITACGVGIAFILGRKDSAILEIVRSNFGWSTTKDPSYKLGKVLIAASAVAIYWIMEG